MVETSHIYLDFFLNKLCTINYSHYNLNISSILNQQAGKNKKFRFKLKNRKNKRNSNNKNSKNKSNKIQNKK